MVTATAWVPRGFAAPFPTKYEFDEEEFDRIAKLAKLQLTEAEEDLEEAKAGLTGGDDMDEDEDDDDSGSDLEETEGAKVKKSKGYVLSHPCCTAHN